MPLVPGIGAAVTGGAGGLSGAGGAGGIGGVTGGREWQIDGVDGVSGPAPEGKSFGSILSGQMQTLDKLQGDAATAAQGLADGTATDPTAAVMAVERAKLAMQMASQLRTKGVEAINDIFHTTV